MNGRRTAITTREAIARLEAIDVSDPERAHAEADAVLLAAVTDTVRAAHEHLVSRAAWWVTA